MICLISKIVSLLISNTRSILRPDYSDRYSPGGADPGLLCSLPRVRRGGGGGMVGMAHSVLLITAQPDCHEYGQHLYRATSKLLLLSSVPANIVQMLYKCFVFAGVARDDVTYVTLS